MASSAAFAVSAVLYCLRVPATRSVRPLLSIRPSSRHRLQGLPLPSEERPMGNRSSASIGGGTAIPAASAPISATNRSMKEASTL